MAKLYDCLIIGAGPAGLGVATGLARLQHTSLVFDSGVYRNALAKNMHNVLGFDHRDPAEYRAAARKDLAARYGDIITFKQATIQEVRKLESGRFEAVDSTGAVYAGKKLCLATGVRDVMPDVRGYADCWTKGIFHCLFCHGYEERGKPSAGVLALPMLTEPAMVMHLGNMALQLAGKVTVYTNGDSVMTAKMRETLAAKSDSRITLEPRKIAKLAMQSDQGSEVVVTFDDGASKVEGFIAHPPVVELNGPFVEQLGLELTPTGEIKTSPPFNQTSVPGVFAAGDVSSLMRAVVQATCSGSMVAAGLAAQVEAEMEH